MKPVPSKSSLNLSNSPVKAALVQTTMKNFVMEQGLTATEQEKFITLVLQKIVDCKSPFTFAHEVALKKLCEFLRPGSSEHLLSIK